VSQGNGAVHARVSKLFFVEMITRDLSVADCLLDLVDNSIDQAVQDTSADVMAALTHRGKERLFKRESVTVELSANRVVVADTCGGIPVSEARNRIFLFGDPQKHGAPLGLSVYGIGMKRAFFKLGGEISIQSATKDEELLININVGDWLKKGDDDWDFAFSYAGRRKTGTQVGTRIEVTALRDEVSARIGETSFRTEFERRVAATYALFLEAGLELTVGKRPIESSLPSLATHADLTTARKAFTFDGVQILIMAGVSPASDRTPRGWYVFCNGRMVLESDRSRLTGWGDGQPQWHSKFSHFVGFVYFRSRDASRLPWTTTKQNVVFESDVYQAALREMQVQSRPVLNFLSQMYSPDAELGDVPERDLLRQAKPIDVTAVPQGQRTFSAVPARRVAEPVVSIQFKKPEKEVDRARAAIGKRNLSAGKVGEHAFDYFLEHEAE
jgi:hypothetical protein